MKSIIDRMPGSLAMGGSPDASGAGLSVTSPRALAPGQSRLRAFHCYPCRSGVLVLAILLAVSARAQVVSLDSVLARIERHNPMLQEYDSRAQALRAYAEGASSWMPPMIGAGTFMTPYPNQTVMEESSKGAWMVSAQQEIPNPSKLKARKKYMESRAAIEAQSRDVRFNALRSEAKQMYYEWLVAEKKLNVLQESKDIIELVLKLARIRYPYNQGSLGNIYKAEGRLAEVDNMVQMTRATIEERALGLKALMNVPLEDSIMIDTASIVSYASDRLAYDTASLAEKRSDIRQINRTIETMRLNQQLQRYQARPDFSIRFDHMQPIGDMPSQFTAMAMVSIPIAPWASKMYKAEVKGMELDIQAMNKGRQAIMVEAQGMLAAMASQLARMEQQLDNYEQKIVPALRKNYKTLMLAYEENREQLPIVIDAWEALNMAQLDQLEKIQEYYTMIVRYEKELEK